MRWFVFVLFLAAPVSAQVIDTMPNFPRQWMYGRVKDTPEQKKAKEQFCQEFGHDWSTLGWMTLMNCPDYTVELADKVIHVFPNCNQRRSSCRRCGLPTPPIPSDTVVVRTFSDPDVIARRKYLLEQMEARLEVDTTLRIELDIPAYKYLQADTTLGLLDTSWSVGRDTIDRKGRRGREWTRPIIDTGFIGTTVWVRNEEDTIKKLWKKIRSLQKQLRKYQTRIDTTMGTLISFRTERDTRKEAVYQKMLPMYREWLFRRKH